MVELKRWTKLFVARTGFSPARDLLAALIMLLVSAWTSFSIFQWPSYRDLLGPDLILSAAESLAVGLFLLAVGHAAFLPALLGFLVCSRLGFRRLSHYVLLVGVITAMFLSTLDLLLQKMIGSHLSYFMPYVLDALRHPTAGHAQWGGDTQQALAEALLLMCLFVVDAVVALAAGRWWADRQIALKKAIWAAALAFFLPILLCVPALATIGQPAVLLTLSGLTPIDALPVVRQAETLRRAVHHELPHAQIVSVVPSPRLKHSRGKIVLLNTSQDTIELDGWRLDYAEQSLPLSGRLGSLEEHEVVVPLSAAHLPKEKGRLRLTDSKGRVVDQVDYRSAGPGSQAQFPVRKSFDAVRKAIDRGAKKSFRSTFAGIREVGAAELPKIEPKRRPHIVLVVAESLRYELLSPQILNRLNRWADGGLRLEQHFSSSNSSHWGVFSLLYGRSPFLYGRALDAGVPPQMVSILSSIGYETHFITASELKGFRDMDRFVNSEAFDTTEKVGNLDQDWTSTWAGDREVLQAVRRRLAAADSSPTESGQARPQFIVAFLVATHFPYHFPADFEIHRPTGGEVKYSNWTRIPRNELYNRYLNTSLYLEQEMLSLVSELDPQRHVILFTGDHGESMFEDGTLAHGTRPSDIQLRVPFAMVGPGVPARRISTTTWHGDVLPTLLHALADQNVPLKHAQGRNLMLGEPPDRALLAPLKWWSPVDLVLVRGTERWLFQAYTDRPEISLVGRLDHQGRIDLSSAASCDPKAVVADLHAELELLAR